MNSGDLALLGGGGIYSLYNSVLITEVSFGERRIKVIHSTCCQIILSLLEGCTLARVSFKRRTNVTVHVSGPPLIRTPNLPNNFVLIREVSFGERE